MVNCELCKRLEDKNIVLIHKYISYYTVMPTSGFFVPFFYYFKVKRK